MKTTVNLHEAGVVQRSDDFGTRLHNTTVLRREHGSGDVGVLYGKRAPKAAALLLIGEIDERETAYSAQELPRAISYMQHPQ